MTSKTKQILTLVVTTILIVAPVLVQAALVNCGGTPNHTNECQLKDLFLTIANVINLLFSIAWLVALLFILWAGWGMVNSGGNEEAITTAKATLSSAIVGFFLVIASFLLLNFMISLLSGQPLSYADSVKDAFHIIGL